MCSRKIFSIAGNIFGCGRFYAAATRLMQIGALQRALRQKARKWRLASKQVWRLRQQLARSKPLDDSFNLARKSFEISQSHARQLFNFILSRLPLLQMSLEQAPTFVRLMNIVARGSVYSPSRIDSLPQQVFINHS